MLKITVVDTGEAQRCRQATEGGMMHFWFAGYCFGFVAGALKLATARKAFRTELVAAKQDIDAQESHVRAMRNACKFALGAIMREMDAQEAHDPALDAAIPVLTEAINKVGGSR